MPTTATNHPEPIPKTLDHLPQDGVKLLIQLRIRLLHNYIRQTLTQQPVKLLGTASSILLIWMGLYVLLVETLRLVRRPVLEGIVATPLIFTFFFLALTAMLAFSTAILSYGGLFRRAETAYLLASPLRPRDLVIVRYIESLLMASWSLVLLGLPLMMALARVFQETWSFYPLFLGLFLCFIPIPGAVGLLLAWLIAMICPKTPRRAMILVAALLAAGTTWWLWRIIGFQMTAAIWLGDLYDHLAIIQSAILPHTWVSKGINLALQGQTASAAFYLFVTLANALFVSVIAVSIITRNYVKAFAQAQVSGTRSMPRSGRILAWIADLCFAYLPRQQRLLATKDLKNFFRDPLQWSQMAILFGLLALYVSNIQRLWTDLANPQLQVLIAFLNLTAVSLILATFTSRFVFPLVSLEGRQLWMLGLLPLPRSRMVWAKFSYALTITLMAALTVMGVSIYRLGIPTTLAAVHLVAIGAICVGLCGVSIGMGARMPLFSEHNPARIAGGFGGTISLLISVVLVVGSLIGVGLMSFQAAKADFAQELTLSMTLWLVAIVTANITIAAVAMRAGIRHFERVET